MSNNPDHIVVIGDTMLDYYLEIPEASPDEKLTAVNSHRALGGTGANAAATIAALGAAVDLVSTISDDHFGDWIMAALADLAVGQSYVTRMKGQPPHATIITGGTRKLIIDRGVADTIVMPPEAWIQAHSLIYVSNPPPVLPLLSAARHTTLVITVEHQMVERMEDSLTGVDYILTNEAGFAALASRYAVLPPTIETRGAAGVILHTGNARAAIPALSTEVVDETGAGDAFAGAFCQFLASRRPLRQAIELSAIVAALTVGTSQAHLTGIDKALVEGLWRDNYELKEGPGDVVEFASI
ncbi:MAG: carbohydrate kinase family protein [Microbacteriaceae bacterium]|nr:MAG: carbohydrate kinase family protein [Microbacteriaceae bacterium]